MTAKSNLELVQELFETRLDSTNQKIDTNNINLIDKIDTNNRNLAKQMDINNSNILELLVLIRAQIDSVEKQTTKTNGRVTKAEGDIIDLYKKSGIPQCFPQLEEIRRDVDKLDAKVTKLDEDNFIIKVWNRYPKQTIAVLGTSILLLFGSVAYGLYEVHKFVKEIKVEQITSQNAIKN